MMQDINSMLNQQSNSLGIQDDLGFNFNPLLAVNEVAPIYINEKADGFVAEFNAEIKTAPAEDQLDIPTDEDQEKEIDPSVLRFIYECFTDRKELIDIGVKVEDTCKQFSLEDSLFSGTNGELALRLLASIVLTNVPPGLVDNATGQVDTKLFTELQNNARNVFFGYKVWTSNVVQFNYYNKSVSPPVKVDIGELWDTFPAKWSMEDLIEISKSKKHAIKMYPSSYIMTKESVSVSKGSVILAGDASFVFVSSGNSITDKKICLELSNKLQMSHFGLNIPVFIINNAEYTLKALVELSPSQSLGLNFGKDIELSVAPYLDLKVGAWPPWLKLPDDTSNLVISSKPEVVLATSVCPAFFIAGINKGVWEKSSVLGSIRAESVKIAALMYKDKGGMTVHSAEIQPEMETVVFARYNNNIAIGYLGNLLNALTNERDMQRAENRASLVKEVFWTELTAKRAYLLFGPPMHLFIPERMLFGQWIPIEDACRLFPNCPKVQMPARLKESSPEDVARAMHMFNEVAPGGWTSTDKKPPTSTSQVSISQSDTTGRYIRPRTQFRQPFESSPPQPANSSIIRTGWRR